jgi:DNA-directed RNA polymerase subunit beta'
VSEPIAAVRISLASPEAIRSWSSGEVTLPETINYRTHQPVKDGLFCERIFGPVKDWTCSCGKYRRERQPGRVCERCGVEIAPSRVRRERMGHIELAAPCVHPWFSRGSPSPISLLLNLSKQECACVLAFTGYLVTEVDERERSSALAHPEAGKEADRERLRTLSPGDYLEEAAYRRLSAYGQVFRAATGPGAVKDRLAGLDLARLSSQLRGEYHQARGAEKARLAKRLQVVEAFRRGGGRPEWMVLCVLPVLPPDLRPLILLTSGRLASSDLNVLYEKVLHRNRRLRHFQDHGAPTIILNQEKRMLQEAVDALFDNAHQRRPVTHARRGPLKSLTDTLSGKTGRFRKHLLGKRVDYSGRSVIVGNPRLRLHQCGLPKTMACELFKPFLIRKLVDRGLAQSVHRAKHMVERRHPAIWDLLAECLYERVILLNRAPTLHRLSIQAFEPVLVEGNALHLHPQVCSAFNADFDGDQMAVHLPLSDAAQDEAKRLMLSTHNLRSPASGDPALAISQEQVLGLYYLTEERASPKRAGRAYTGLAEVMHALHAGAIDVHTRISVRVEEPTISDAPGKGARSAPSRGRVETTAGRLLFNAALPEGLRYKNYAMTKDALKQIVAECLARYGEETTVALCDALKSLGFAYATRSGISFALSDIVTPPERNALIAEGQHRQHEIDELYASGEIAEEERYRQTITLWTDVTEQVSRAAKAALPEAGTLMTIVKSGATKAKFQQIRQLSGIRGLMASPSGKILPVPILSSYLSGLLGWEIFIAASGARKGFMDRSLFTALCGYLTRKLVEVGMATRITLPDCGTKSTVFITREQAEREGHPRLGPLVVGRVLARPAADLAAGTLVTEEIADHLVETRADGLWIRSVLTCQAPIGLCQQCYGADPATGELVKLGAAVGVVAGQSIGEPGTQLTMRTFHSGGIANAESDITLGLPRVIQLFEIRTPKQKAILSDLAGEVVIEDGQHAGAKRVRVRATHTFFDSYPLPERCQVTVKCLSQVERGQQLARTPPCTGGQSTVIRARSAGQVAQVTSADITLTVAECEERVYDIPAGRHLCVGNGERVEVGSPLTAGAIDPKELLGRCGTEAVGRYLTGEVQRVYRSTGVYIRDQHPEIIVRQMLRYVQISEEGDTTFLPGEIVDRFVFVAANARVLAQGGAPARGRPVLLGLTRTALQTSSWIVAASFQETSRVLAHAAIGGRSDPLLGLKEKIVLGLRIPTWEAS